MINTYLLSLRPSQQVGLLFVLLFGMLMTVSVFMPLSHRCVIGLRATRAFRH